MIFAMILPPLPEVERAFDLWRGWIHTMYTHHVSERVEIDLGSAQKDPKSAFMYIYDHLISSMFRNVDLVRYYCYLFLILAGLRLFEVVF